MVGAELGVVVKDAGVKQCELSKRACLNASLVSEILSGRRVPTRDQLNRLVRGIEDICEILTKVNDVRFRQKLAEKN